MELKFKDFFKLHLADAVNNSMWLFNTDDFDNERLLEVVCGNLQCHIERKYFSDLEEEFYTIFGEFDKEQHIMKLAIAINNTNKIYEIFEQ